MFEATRSKLVPVILGAGLFAIGACASVENEPPSLENEEEIPQAQQGEAQVEVSLENGDITLEPGVVEPGTVVFYVFNNGDVNHDFEIRALGDAELDREIKFTLDPDNREDFEVDLDAGTYRVLCTVGNHERQGEAATLRVGSIGERTDATGR